MHSIEERDEEGYLTNKGYITFLRNLRDNHNLGSDQRDDLSTLIGSLIYTWNLEE
jgi:hypothetical protein